MKLYLSFLLLSLTACSSTPTGASRNLSSWRGEVVLDHLLEAESPKDASRDFVRRLLRIRLRSQAWLQEFDLGLAAHQGDGVDIFSLPVYRKLLVARPLAERTEAKIVGIYGEARALAAKASGDAAAKEREGRAFLVVEGVEEALSEARKSPAQSVLLHELFEEMRGKFDLGDSLRASMFAPLKTSVGEAARKSAREMEKLVRELPASDAVNEEVEEGAKRLGEMLEAEKRETSAISIYPTAGLAGNITGMTFPRGTYALTYDDGPHVAHTMANVNNLRAQGVKATFFWIAKHSLMYPQIVKAVQKTGMALGNHSYMHAKVTDWDHMRDFNTNPTKEIIGSTAELTRIFGFKPKYYRLPYAAGLDDVEIRRMIASQGMVHVKWNIDSLDWQDRNPATVVARVEQQMRMNGRGIILFHDVVGSTVNASRILMERHRGQVRWVTIPEIVDELNSTNSVPAPVTPPPARPNPHDQNGLPPIPPYQGQ